MAACKGQECFFGRSPMRHIRLQQFFDGLRRLLRRDVVKHLLPDTGLRTEAAAREDMKAIDGGIAIADRDARTDQADVADVMLRAGMVATGEMDVDRRLDRHER